MDSSDLGNRIKSYEKNGRLELDPLLPVVIRLDGNSFSKFTKSFKKPFDPLISTAMETATKAVFERTSHCKIGYTQSDEITLIVEPSQDGIFGNRIDKICSILASSCTNSFNEYLRENTDLNPLAEFDCRAFNVPNLQEAQNALLWRQFDCWKNFIGVVAHCKFGHKKLHKKNTNEKIKMLEDSGVFAEKDFPEFLHFGLTLYKTTKLMPIPEEFKGFPQNKGKTHISRNIFTSSTGKISPELFNEVMKSE